MKLPLASALVTLCLAVAPALAAPPRLPTQQEAREAFVEHAWMLVRSGILKTPIKTIERIDTSSLSCAFLGGTPQHGGNFVCGGEIRFHGDGSEIYRIHYSPTMRQSPEGAWEFYNFLKENWTWP